MFGNNPRLSLSSKLRATKAVWFPESQTELDTHRMTELFEEVMKVDDPK